MTQTLTTIQWPSEWPFETNEDFQQVCIEITKLYKQFQSIAAKIPQRMHINVTELEFLHCQTCSVWETRLMARSLTTENFYEVICFNPLKLDEINSTIQRVEKVKQRAQNGLDVVHIQCFEDRRWELLQNFDKTMYIFVLFIDRGRFAPELTTKLLQRDFSAIEDAELAAAITSSLVQHDSQAPLAKQFLDIASCNASIAQFQSTYSTTYALLTQAAEGASVKDKAEAQTPLSQEIKGLRDVILRALKEERALTTQDKYSVATLYGFYRKFSHSKQLFMSLLSEVDEGVKGIVNYMIYYYAFMANQLDEKDKYLGLTIQIKSGLPDHLLTVLKALHLVSTKQQKLCVGLLQAQKEKLSGNGPLLRAVFRANLANVLRGMKSDDQKSAIVCYRQAFDMIKGEHPEHVLLPFLSHQSALVYSQLQNFIKSKNILENETMKYLASIYGENSYEASQLCKEIANQYLKLGHKQKAKDFLAKRLHNLEKSTEEHYIELADNYNQMATVLKEMGDRKSALTHLQAALELLDRYSDQEHKLRGMVLNNLGELLTNTGEFDDAKTAFIKALEINKDSQGLYSDETAKNYLNLGVLYKRIKQDGAAAESFEKCIDVKVKLLGLYHHEVGFLLNNLAIVHRDLGDYKQAFGFYERSLGIFRKSHGVTHPLVALSLSNMAMLQKSMGNIDQALNLYHDSLFITRQIQGEEHPDYAVTLKNLAMIHVQKGDYETALECMKRAYSVFRSTYGDNHSTVINLLQNIKTLKSKIASIEEEQRAKSETDLAQSSRLEDPKVIAARQRIEALYSMNYTQEEEKEFMPQKDLVDADELPPSVRRNSLRAEQLLSKPATNITDHRPTQQTQQTSDMTTLPEKVQEPQDELMSPAIKHILEEYSELEFEIGKAFQHLKQLSSSYFSIIVTNPKVLEKFCMGLVDELNNFPAPGEEVTEEGRNRVMLVYAENIHEAMRKEELSLDKDDPQHSAKPSEKEQTQHPQREEPEAVAEADEAMAEGEDQDAMQEIVAITGFDASKAQWAYFTSGRNKEDAINMLYDMYEA